MVRSLAAWQGLMLNESNKYRRCLMLIQIWSTTRSLISSTNMLTALLTVQQRSELLPVLCSMVSADACLLSSQHTKTALWRPLSDPSASGLVAQIQQLPMNGGGMTELCFTVVGLTEQTLMMPISTFRAMNPMVGLTRRLSICRCCRVANGRIAQQH